MAASDLLSKGVAVIGISPAKEAQKSNLPSRLVAGAYLSENDDGVLIGEGLAKYLKVSVGDTLALIGQGYHGASAAGLFPVRGILKLMTAEMDSGILYTTLPAAQNFIDMPDGYSGILISLNDNKRLTETLGQVKQSLDSQTLDIYSWHFTMERLLRTAELDKAMAVAVMYILYLVVGFGVLGTVIMMTNERKREFCMMISLGMSRMKLLTATTIELVVMSLIGVALAVLATLPIAHWFAARPIKLTGNMAAMYLQYGLEPVLPTSVAPSIFIDQVLVILVIVFLTALYPVSKIARMKIIP
jgi:ABC-type lipoprotein release transport system permease subunit